MGCKDQIMQQEPWPPSSLYCAAPRPQVTLTFLPSFRSQNKWPLFSQVSPATVVSVMNVFQSTRLPPEFNMPRPHRDNLLASHHRKWVNQCCRLPVAQRTRKETNKSLLFDIPRSVGELGFRGKRKFWGRDRRSWFVACFYLFVTWEQENIA